MQLFGPSNCVMAWAWLEMRRGRDPCRLHCSAVGAQSRIIGNAKAKGVVDRRAQHDWGAHARRNHSAPFRSPRELGLVVLGLAPMAPALPARYSANGWKDSDPSPPCWTSHPVLFRRASLPSWPLRIVLLKPTSGLLAGTQRTRPAGPAARSHRRVRGGPSSGVHVARRVSACCPAAATVQEREAYAVFLLQGPCGRRVMGSQPAWCGLAGRGAQGAILVCVDRLMGPEPRTGTWGLAANIPQQGCS